MSGTKAGQGMCKRFPPVLNPKFVMEAASPNVALKVEAWVFPRVQGNEYCGEYQTRPSSPGLTAGR
jgi:hypothetical protein